MDEIHAWHQPLVDIALLFALLIDRDQADL